MKPIAQKKCRSGAQKQAAMTTQVSELLKVGIIRELQYATWLANVVMVQKKDGRWRMCIDYTYLNKQSFPLPRHQ